MKNSLKFLLIFNLVALPLLYFWGRPIFFHGAPEAASLPVYAQMSSFQLTREDGTAFGDAQMKGNFWVAQFMFTRCPDLCPMMSVKFGALQDALEEDVKLASFSVDPGNDDAETLQKYAKNYNAKKARWVFLTGEPSTVQRIMEEIHLGKTEEPGMHSLRYVLLDKGLRVRGYYDSTDSASLAKLTSDIKDLRKEK